ncbi:MAG: cyclase family protein [Actinomycetota bacterium]
MGRADLEPEPLAHLLEGLGKAAISIVDLTQSLSEDTPTIMLPDPFVNTPRFSLEELSRYDERGPAWYWNAFKSGEHVGTHFDAPNHWVTGKDLDDVASVPVDRLVAPAVVIDKSAESAANPDYLLTIEDVRAWEAEHGPLPAGGWLLYRTGWDERAHDQQAFLNADDTGPHTPGFDPECARWLAEDTEIVGVGVETVGTDAGAAHSFEPAFPCHSFMLGANKYGLTQLANVAKLPPTGTVLIVAPLKITGGSGSPCRVLALVPG